MLLILAAVLTAGTTGSAYAQEPKCKKECCKKCDSHCKEKCCKEDGGQKCENKKSSNKETAKA